MEGTGKMCASSLLSVDVLATISNALDCVEKTPLSCVSRQEGGKDFWTTRTVAIGFPSVLSPSKTSM